MGDALAAELADLRLFFFVGALLVIACIEWAKPARGASQPRARRWSTNLSLILMSSLLLRAIPAFAASVAAVFATKESIGLFNNISIPFIAGVICSVVLLDLIIYVQHVLTHKLNFLWRLHQVHHSDRDFDVSTAVRFHPIEILLSMGLKCSAVLLLGAPLISVVVFEILLSVCALFTHANFRFPEKTDRQLRWFFVTPDMHRIHHSEIRNEHDSNYGTCTSLWDRMFHTYTTCASNDQSQINIGLKPYPSRKTNHLLWTLLLPFKNK